MTYYQQNPGICSRKSRGLALTLCWIVGVLGVHKFYLGKPGMGVFYLLTGGGFGIGWLIDLALITTGHAFDDQGLRVVNWLLSGKHGDAFQNAPNPNMWPAYQSTQSIEERTRPAYGFNDVAGYQYVEVEHPNAAYEFFKNE